MTGQSSSPVKRRGLAAVVTVLAIVLGGALHLVVGRDAVERGGPLANPDWSETSLPLPEGTTDGTFGVFFPATETTGEIEILSIEPLNTSNIDVLGMSILDQELGIGAAASWPPAGVETLTPVEGAVVPIGENGTLQIILGARKIDPGLSGRIEDLRLRYRFEDTTYETTFNASLVLD